MRSAFESPLCGAVLPVAIHNFCHVVFWPHLTPVVMGLECVLIFIGLAWCVKGATTQLRVADE